ncbi:MAG: YicC/YloC family endoribonuclease [Planctomycetota bacterium]
MTGFGGASAQEGGAQYVVEIRSFNSKFFKALIRLPDELQGLEAELEAQAARRLNRGSVILTIRFADTSENAAARINPKAIQRYLDQLMSVPGLDREAARVDLGAMLGLPGVVMNDTGEALLERARPVLLRITEEACGKLLDMRTREGESLRRDLHRHLDRIAEHLAVTRERVPVVVEQYQERLRQRMAALLAESGTAVRDEDLLREVAVFAERSDIAEEVSRLQGHLEQFGEIIDAADDEPSGRTLDFLSQEMLREANTIASKCLDVEIARHIVQIKGAIDRIKEQAQNVE